VTRIESKLKFINLIPSKFMWSSKCVKKSGEGDKTNIMGLNFFYKNDKFQHDSPGKEPNKKILLPLSFSKRF